jgi:DNA-binding NarL/FixJ family response regulator
MAAKDKSPRRKVVIVEDHPVFANGLSLLLDQNPTLTVCGSATRVEQARKVIRKIKPDLLIVDLALPDGNGFDLISEMAAQFPAMAILVLSMADEMIYARRALRAGARGYLMKHEPPQRLVQAALEVLNGRTCVSSALQSEISRGIQRTGATDPIEELSERERAILVLIGEGRTAAVIGTQLGISTKTVDSYRTLLKQKLGARDSHELMCRAIQLRIENGPA